MFNETAAFLGVSSPYVVVFLLLTFGIWIFPFAEEFALLAVGYLIYRGAVEWWLMVPVAALGVFLGDAVLFWLGRRYGSLGLQRLATMRRYEREIKSASALLDRYGAAVLFCARFLPGVRFPAHVVAGTSGMAVSAYVAICAFAIVFYMPCVVMLAYTLGEEIENASHSLHNLGAVSWVLVVIVISLWRVLQRWSGARRTARYYVPHSGINSAVSSASPRRKLTET
jgi:membrane protein DedA with SNARE-associated domain